MYKLRHKSKFCAINRQANKQPFKDKNQEYKNFWGLLSQKVCEGGWEATNAHQLIQRMNEKLSEIDLKTVKNLMKRSKEN